VLIAAAGCLFAGWAMPAAVAAEQAAAANVSSPVPPCAATAAGSYDQRTSFRTTIIRGSATEESVASVPAGTAASNPPCRPAPAK